MSILKKIRAKTRDIAFPFRMGAGFAGDVNRTHPCTIEPALIDVNAPPTAYGQAVLVDASTQGVRPFAHADQSDTVAAGYGITVRPYPTQQSSGSNFGAASVGSATPPVTGVIDVMRAGYIMATVVGTAVKGAPVYVWADATGGGHTLGGMEAVYASGSTTKLLNATFNGTQDASGNVEIAFNI